MQERESQRIPIVKEPKIRIEAQWPVAEQRNDAQEPQGTLIAVDQKARTAAQQPTGRQSLHTREEQRTPVLTN